MQQQISLLLRLPQSESVHYGHFLKLLRYHMSRVELSYYGNMFRQQSALQFTRCMPDYPATSVVFTAETYAPITMRKVVCSIQRKDGASGW